MTPSEFKALFPDGEFDSLGTNYIQTFLDQAVPMFDVARWNSLYSEGLACYVAASIVVSKARARRALVPNSGAMTSKSVGDTSASYDGQLLNRQADDTLMTNEYGRRYVELRNMVGLGGFVGVET